MRSFYRVWMVDRVIGKLSIILMADSCEDAKKEAYRWLRAKNFTMHVLTADPFTLETKEEKELRDFKQSLL
jgi:hypothetical protein